MIKVNKVNLKKILKQKPVKTDTNSEKIYLFQKYIEIIAIDVKVNKNKLKNGCNL